MKVRLFGVIEAYGTPEELSLFTSLFFSAMKEVAQIQQEQEVDGEAAELFKILEESMKKKGDT